MSNKARIAAEAQLSLVTRTVEQLEVVKEWAVAEQMFSVAAATRDSIDKLKELRKLLRLEIGTEVCVVVLRDFDTVVFDYTTELDNVADLERRVRERYQSVTKRGESPGKEELKFVTKVPAVADGAMDYPAALQWLRDNLDSLLEKRGKTG